MIDAKIFVRLMFSLIAVLGCTASAQTTEKFSVKPTGPLSVQWDDLTRGIQFGVYNAQSAPIRVRARLRLADNRRKKEFDLMLVNCPSTADPKSPEYKACPDLIYSIPRNNSNSFRVRAIGQPPDKPIALRLNINEQSGTPPVVTEIIVNPPKPTETRVDITRKDIEINTWTMFGYELPEIQNDIRKMLKLQDQPEQASQPWSVFGWSPIDPKTLKQMLEKEQRNLRIPFDSYVPVSSNTTFTLQADDSSKGDLRGCLKAVSIPQGSSTGYLEISFPKDQEAYFDRSKACLPNDAPVQSDQPKVSSLTPPPFPPLQPAVYKGTLNGVIGSDNKAITLTVRVRTVPWIPLALIAVGLIVGYYFRRYVGVITPTERLLYSLHQTIQKSLRLFGQSVQHSASVDLENHMTLLGRNLDGEVRKLRDTTTVLVEIDKDPFQTLTAKVNQFKTVPELLNVLCKDLIELERPYHALKRAVSRNLTAPDVTSLQAWITSIGDVLSLETLKKSAEASDVSTFVAGITQYIVKANVLIAQIKSAAPMLFDPPAPQPGNDNVLIQPKDLGLWMRRLLPLSAFGLTVLSLVNGPLELLIVAVVISAFSYLFSERYSRRIRVYGKIGFSIPSWRDAVLFLIPLIPLLLTGFNDLYAKPTAFGTPLDLLGALTWGFGSQGVIQTFFAVLERLPVGRFFAK
jgi:hypothetical protein